jgi:hypothetical protein
MEERLIFPGLLGDDERSGVLRSIKSITYMIPSLRTFFEDQKYIEPCCSILKTLINDPKRRRTLWRGYSSIFVAPEIFRVQFTEKASKRVSSQSQKELGYLQLWMFCLRNYPEMTDIKPLLTSRGTRTRWEQNLGLWQKLGTLAVNLGFRTPTAVKLAKGDPDRECARRFLEMTRPHCSDLESSVNEVTRVLRGIEERLPVPTDAFFTSSQPLSYDRRCGKPHGNDFASDRSALFLSLFSKEVKHGPFITPLYVKRNALESFLEDYTSKVRKL